MPPAAPRKPDWPSRLAASIESARKRRFAWGEHDCCLFACACIAAMTGVDPARGFRGRYRNRRGALRALRRRAGGGLAETVAALAARHGYAEIAPLKAGRGDLVLLTGRGAGPDGLGICVGRAALVATPEGLQAITPQAWQRAWKI